jgi:glycosyltransferase involved in cell wall biosynthesis
MTGRIHFLGHLDQQELSRLLPHCITVSPLTGMALTEAGLAGSPMVVFDRDWQADFVTDGVNGYVVPFLDHEAMADRIERIIADEGTRRRMAVAARERALEFADTSRIYAREHEALDEVLNAGPR